MKRFNAAITSLMLLSLILSVLACAPKQMSNTSESDTEYNLNIAYQYGLSYAPLIICKENKLIEQKFKELTGEDVTITWNQMSSGADINTGFMSGDLNVGFMGIAPAITGISNNVGYKIFTNLSGQEHGLMTNNEQLHSLDDLINSDNQIALVNIGSIQHIILGLALDAAGFDAHILDSNLVALKHPDGMAAIESNNISCHLTTNPYIYRERKNSSLHELDEVKSIWSSDKSFIVGVAAQSLYENNPELYNALCYAISESINYINSNLDEAAALTADFDGNSLEDEITYMQSGKYSVETTGIYELSQFMYKNGFINNSFDAYYDLVFDNVKGN